MATGRTSPIDKKCDHQFSRLFRRELPQGQHYLVELAGLYHPADCIELFRFRIGGKTMGQERSSIISAEVILKSQSGRSLAQSGGAVTADNIEEFKPAAETMAEATQRLQALGFTVRPGGVTLTLLGSPAQFEDVFRVKLTIEKDERTGGMRVRPDGVLVIPDELRDIVEAVVFPEPPEFFA
jgi:hypothetical protein